MLISNNQPDVARFADLHLFNHSDDQYAQQLKIVEIIRHPLHTFRARYHDIALMRLEHKVKVPPSFVRYYGEKTNPVVRHYQNPNWTTGSLYGDVGLLTLKDPIVFSPNFYPACIWDRPKLEQTKYEVSGRGLLELNIIESFEDTPLEESAVLNRTISLLGVIDVHNGSDCSLPEQAMSVFANGLADEHLCFGTEQFLVPGTCQQAYGGPIQREYQPGRRILMCLYALNLFGRDCGFDCHLRYYSFGSSGAVAPASGRPAYLREFAHIGAIGWSQPDGTVRWDCGGSLIWENFLLTAAHCASDTNNEPPDVVRFGDLNLFNDTDDQFAQQYKIAEIIRHPEHRFSAKYHDIALFKLQKNVTLNETVAPACLWSDDEIRFRTLEAAGWGATGFGQSQTPLLLKVSLKPVGRDQCDRLYRVGDRGLRDGLQDYQLCAGDVEMDTCPGDSGGPLQVKLLHNAKMTPFVLAVTSFGSACGQSNPGVYTKVASYIPWIRSVISKHVENAQEVKFEPYACALRYVHLREYEPDIIAFKGKEESLDFRGVHVMNEDSPSTVVIGWDKASDATAHDPNCHGVLIDEDSVITLAQCTALNGKPPTHIIALEYVRRGIAWIIKHPEYKVSSSYNNIAIVKLEKPFFFESKLFLPACPWYFPQIPTGEFEVTGRGRFDLNVIPLYDSQEINTDSTISSLILRSSELHATNCSLSKEHQARLEQGLSNEHICFGHGNFLVPETCDQKFGGAIQRNLFRLSKYFKYVYALNLLGRDCGFGEPAVGVRLGSYIEWMSKILLPSRRHAAEPVQFYNTDLELDDHCKRSDASYGMCVVIDRCPRVRYDLDVQRRVTFCGNGTIVCCPFHNVLNNTQATRTELDECKTRYKTLHTKGIYEQFLEKPIEERFPHVIMIAWQTSDGSFDFCIGTLVARSMALSSADCLSRIDTNQTVVKLGWEKTAPTLWVKEVILHPQYEESTLRNDIGIVKIKGTVDPSTGKLPACIWQNQTHTPFHLRQFMLSDLQYLNSYPKYNKDCEVYGHYGNRSLEPTQLCADLEQSDYRIDSGEPSFWQQQQLSDGESVVHYLVGIVSYVFPGMTVQTRVESYVDWIASHLG
uniref:Peptidase S1 domain-containing protein n=1 Tax=Anopheles farauti TaxID=69004 RepID=A0A182Q718_9DIPT